LSQKGVVDASALVDVLLESARGRRVTALLDKFESVHAPAHVDAEVLSALARLHRAGMLDAPVVSARLAVLAGATVERHPVAPLLAGAWARRGHLRTADAIHVELAEQLSAELVTTDAKLASALGLSLP
jgi:predicted nucleic acid-binding protein